MIWNSNHINEHVLKLPSRINKLINKESNLKNNTNHCFTIGIIGGGPKGMYAIDELIRNYKIHKLNSTLKIYWWNESNDFGCGPNYCTNQPDYLLINYCIGNINTWDETDITHQEKLNFVQWINKNKITEIDAQPTDYSSRTLVGFYLQYMVLEIIKSLPESIDLVLLKDTVCNVKINENDKINVVTESNQITVDNLLLSTGHSYHNKSLVNFSENKIPSNYFLSAYPIQKLSKIAKQEKVGIIGWGLTFIDVALALTEGRGGKFDSDYNYISSGNEPIIIPFSRNQLPIIPRGPIYGNNFYALKYINDTWLKGIKKSSKQSKIDFVKDILPQLEKELRFAYYSTYLKTRDEEIIEKYLKTIPEDELFTYENLLFPRIKESETIQNTFINYLDFLIREAEEGELKSPLMATTAVWREASSYIAELYKFGGFTGDSHKYLDQNLFGAFCRTSYGPPIENMKKIKSLIKSGIIKTYWLEKVNIKYLNLNNTFLLTSNKHKEEVNYLIDARIARPSLNQNNSTLYTNMQNNKIIKEFNNDNYNPGCADILESGKINNNYNIYFYGSNTEGVLLDNDSLSRKKNNLAKEWAKEIIIEIK